MPINPLVAKVQRQYGEAAEQVARRIGYLTLLPAKNLQERKSRDQQVTAQRMELNRLNAESAKLSVLHNYSAASSESVQRVLAVHTGEITREDAERYANNKPLVRQLLDEVMGKPTTGGVGSFRDAGNALHDLLNAQADFPELDAQIETQIQATEDMGYEAASAQIAAIQQSYADAYGDGDWDE